MNNKMNKLSSIKITSAFILVAVFWIACKSNNEEDNVDYSGWQKATGNSNGNKYSSLTAN